MPTEEITSIGEQLRVALADTGVSQAELARRLAAADGTDPGSKRRWLLKILSSPDVIPERRSLAAIVAGLGLDSDYFTVPTRRRIADRRATLEEEVADLTGAVIALLRVTTELCRAVQELGGEVPDTAMQELARVATRT